MPRVTLQNSPDLAAVGARWTALQAVCDGSFFQSWAWVGCEAALRYSNPVVLEAHDAGRLVALALFNRSGDGGLWLGESGNPDLDSVFVEHNGVLCAHDQSADTLAACLDAAWASPTQRLILSGVDAQTRDVVARLPGLLLRRAHPRPAPYVSLSALPPGPDGYLETLSANTRYQIRRSQRRYAASGPVLLERAADLAQAHDFLDRLAQLHQACWTARGKPGAFASAAFRRFHHTLIDRAFPDGAIDLLRMSAGGVAFGFLYNFNFRGRISAYQSGFDYAAADSHQKPGLTSHHLAIEMYRREGAACYDFLAGEDRYKRSLANAATTLHWIEITSRWSPRAWIRWLRDVSQAGKESRE